MEGFTTLAATATQPPKRLPELNKGRLQSRKTKIGIKKKRRKKKKKTKKKSVS